MADINSTATSTIYVNGKPAEQELQKLKQRASDLRDAIAAAAKAGDKADLKKLRSELNSTNREVKQVEKEIQDITDKFIGECDKIFTAKEKEIMTV